MAETADSLFRRGAISAKQAGKMKVSDLPKVLKKTKVERADEESFEGKQGLRDQGGRKDHGHEVAKRDHVNRHQEVAKRSLDGLGAPSKPRPGKDSGGGVKNGRGGSVVAGPDEIDQTANQRKMRKRDNGLGGPSKGGNDANDMDDKRGQDAWGTRPIPNAPKKKLKPSQGGSNPRADTRVTKQGGLYGGGGRDTQ